jgi:hypothetical protein
MNTEIDELLTRLEQLNCRAMDSSDPALEPNVDAAQLFELIRERGKLIEQLKPSLAAHAPVSYVEWNRLVVIHRAGARILDNLNVVRSRVASEIGANSSGRAFLERVTGLLAPFPEQS